VQRLFSTPVIVTVTVIIIILILILFEHTALWLPTLKTVFFSDIPLSNCSV